jgi:hypothetical protein
MTDAPWYVSTSTLHNDLGIPYIKDVIQERSSKHHDRIEVTSEPTPAATSGKNKITEG